MWPQASPVTGCGCHEGACSVWGGGCVVGWRLWRVLAGVVPSAVVRCLELRVVEPLWPEQVTLALTPPACEGGRASPPSSRSGGRAPGPALVDGQRGGRWPDRQVLSGRWPNPARTGRRARLCRSDWGRVQVPPSLSAPVGRGDGPASQETLEVRAGSAKTRSLPSRAAREVARRVLGLHGALGLEQPLWSRGARTGPQ